MSVKKKTKNREDLKRNENIGNKAIIYEPKFAIFIVVEPREVGDYEKWERQIIKFWGKPIFYRADTFMNKKEAMDAYCRGVFHRSERDAKQKL